MTKQELIEKLHENGECWANEGYTKEYLMKYYAGLIEAKRMSVDELRERIRQMTAKQG